MAAVALNHADSAAATGRLATRYDKTADRYLGFIHIVSIRLWNRQFVNAS